MRMTSLLRFALIVFVSVYGSTVLGQAKAQPHYQISGTLVSSVDGAPVADGHLVPTLIVKDHTRRHQFPAAMAAFDTDENGHFIIPLPSAGEWSIAASARGFTRQEYQAHEQFSTAIVLTNAAPSMNIRFVLSPEASITGVVLDEAGDAVRTAQVSLEMVASLVPGQPDRKTSFHAVTMTDDRGEYEFAGLLTGDYRVCVTTRPWYAVTAQSEQGHSADSPSLDPSLDVTYAPTWFPGVDDPAAAETLTLSAGDRREADFHLLPIPSIHLLIAPQAGATGGSSDRFIPFPIIQRVDSEMDRQTFLPISVYRNAQGEIDVDGLSSGLYQVQLAGRDQENKSTVVRVNAGQPQTLDLDDPANESHVTVQVDGLPDSESGSIQINLLDAKTGRVVLESNGRNGFRRAEDASVRDRIFEVPPGQYEIVVQGRPELYLTGIMAKGAEAVGRIVTLAAGDSSLTLHIAEGRAELNGVASFKGKPSVGAMVLLVPATLGNPGAITVVRRDQSNTDGSFSISEVIPGQYILIAIDQGWQVNWSDPSTLHRYLTQGVPLNLAPSAEVKQNLVALAP